MIFQRDQAITQSLELSGVQDLANDPQWRPSLQSGGGDPSCEIPVLRSISGAVVGVNTRRSMREDIIERLTARLGLAS